MVDNKGKILIIDDEEFSAKTLSKMLEKQNLDTVIQYSGIDGIKYLAENKVDLVLLDVMMPNMIGIDVLKIVRKMHSASELPVIMVTTKKEDEDILEALKNGANDYITKPINIEVALARIQTHMNITRMHDQLLYKKEIETINTMIATYSHEINNPLSVAYHYLSKNRLDVSDEDWEKCFESIKRTADIVKKINQLAISEKELELDHYCVGTKIYKVNK